MNNSDSVVVSKAASSSSFKLQQQQPNWYHPQQLLPPGPSGTGPRRGSLPISRSQLRQLQLEGKLKKRQSPSSTEIYVPSDRTRLDDTPEQIRKFLDTIKITAAESEDTEDEVFVASSRSNSFKKKKRNGSLRRGSESSLKRSSSSKSKVDSSSESKMADIYLPEYIEDVEANQNAARLSAEERKALMATTQLTELEMVELWNQYKFNFPTGKANQKQLKQLVRKVFPRCTQPDFVVENIQKVFDSEENGQVSIRELLIAFSMSMKGTPREKLHWAFRLYDADESDTIEEDELEDVFCRLFTIAKNIERAAEEARNPKPKKPRTPTPPPPEPEPESPPTPKKKTSDNKKAKSKRNINKMATAAQVEINVKTMSNKMNQKQEKTRAKQTEAEQRKLQKKKREEAKRLEAEKARLEAEAAAQAEAEAAAAAEKAARAENGEESSEEEEEEIDPNVIAKENARAIFKMLDINRDGQLDEEEFVDGCLADEMFLEMLLTFNCDFLWGDGIC